MESVDKKPNLRRNFLRNFGLAGLLASGAVGAKVVIEEKRVSVPVAPPELPWSNAERMRLDSNGELGIGVTPVNEDIAHLQPGYGDSIIIQGNRKEQTSRYAFQGYDYQNRVVLSVGKDDRLWINVNDKWHRVAIEQ